MSTQDLKNVKAPSTDRKVWCYWAIRAIDKEDPTEVCWVEQRYSGRYQLASNCAQFKEQADAIRVAKYLTKRAQNQFHYPWKDYTYEVVKVVHERNVQLEWPLTILEKLAKV